MYSVISIKGHQYKVEPGQTVIVDKLDNEVNQFVSYPSLLFVDGKTVKVGKSAASMIVNAKIVRHFKGDKIDVERFRAKSRHRRKIGFRPHFTELKIEQITADTKKTVKSKTTNRDKANTNKNKS